MARPKNLNGGRIAGTKNFEEPRKKAKKVLEKRKAARAAGKVHGNFKDDGKKKKINGNANRIQGPGAALQHRHFLVVEAYMRGLSKTECMLYAGYSESTAVRSAHTVFNRPEVQTEIERRRNGTRMRSKFMVDRIQEELSHIAFFNIGNVLEVTDEGELVFDFAEATMEQLAAVGTIEIDEYKDGTGEAARSIKKIKFKPYDKKGALDSLARIYGLFQDNLTVSEGEGKSLEDRLTAGRNRVKKIENVVEGEYEEVE